MINALIITHLWSLVVAGGAWVLQRDGNERVGARFPAPNVWLILIMLSLLPGALYFIPFGKFISIPTTEVFEILPAQISDLSTESARPFNVLLVYIGLGIALMGRTLWRWSRLQSLPLVPTAEPDVFSTPRALPPLALSWPRRAVVIPQGIEAEATLIRHERAHLRHHDAEFTLLLLLLQDVMLRNPGISFLVRQWRLSIELRADRAATKALSPSQRKDYAALLLNIQRPSTERGGALPCPTARLNSTPHRNAKMRLVGIMEDDPGAQKPRWRAAVLLTAIAASGIGFVSAAATASDARLNPEDYVLVDYITKAPLQLPVNCPGLENDLKNRGIAFEEIEVPLNGQLVSRHTINLGTVVLSHDVRRDGSVHNARVLSSTHPCFEPEAKAAIVQRMTAPQEFEIKGAAVKLNFIMLAETPEELNEQLKNYLR